MSKFLYRVCPLLILPKRKRDRELTALENERKQRVEEELYREEEERGDGN